MLLHEGRGENGDAILQPKTVHEMRKDNLSIMDAKTADNEKGKMDLLTFWPNCGFGLGVTTLTKQGLENSYPNKAAHMLTGGWSGAAGTHFYIDSGNELIVV